MVGTCSLSIDLTLELLGKDEALDRIRKGIDALKSQTQFALTLFLVYIPFHGKRASLFFYSWRRQKYDGALEPSDIN